MTTRRLDHNIQRSLNPNQIIRVWQAKVTRAVKAEAKEMEQENGDNKCRVTYGKNTTAFQ